MNKITNLTQHPASAEQKKVGVTDLVDTIGLKKALNFVGLPSEQDILNRAYEITLLALDSGHDAAMIGGALWLMAPLAEMLRENGIDPLFAFSVRESSEKDGVKTSVFRHVGFVPAV